MAEHKGRRQEYYNDLQQQVMSNTTEHNGMKHGIRFY
jgi:hypothetical protein